jgi:hypothetical protein
MNELCSYCSRFQDPASHMLGVQVLAGKRFSLLHTYQTGSAAHPASYQLDTVSYLPHTKTNFCFHASVISNYFNSFKKQFCHFKNESCIPWNRKASTSQFLSVCTLHFILWLENGTAPKIKHNLNVERNILHHLKDALFHWLLWSRKLYQTSRLVVNIQQTRTNQCSFLVNTQTAMIMITTTMFIRNPTHQNQAINFIYYKIKMDRLCGLVVRVPGYRSRCLGLIPDATRFSDK